MKLIPRVADIDLFHATGNATRCVALRDIAYRASGAPKAGRKLVTGGVASPLWYAYHGANRSYPVPNFSPVKQVNTSDPWYYSQITGN